MPSLIEEIPGKTLLMSNDFPPMVSGIATYCAELWKRLPPERTVILAPDLPGADEWDEKTGHIVERRYVPIGATFLRRIVKTS